MGGVARHNGSCGRSSFYSRVVAKVINIGCAVSGRLAMRPGVPRS